MQCVDELLKSINSTNGSLNCLHDSVSSMEFITMKADGHSTQNISNSTIVMWTLIIWPGFYFQTCKLHVIPGENGGLQVLQHPWIGGHQGHRSYEFLRCRSKLGGRLVYQGANVQCGRTNISNKLSKTMTRCRWQAITDTLRGWSPAVALQWWMMSSVYLLKSPGFI